MPARVAPAGPVDIAVIGFVDERPDQKVAAVIAEAVASGAARVLDALIVEKDTAGEVSVIDVDDPADALDALGFSADLPGLLSEADALDIAAELPLGTSAMIIAWESIWVVRVHQALAEAGGVVALHERIDPSELEVAVAAVIVDTEA